MTRDWRRGHDFGTTVYEGKPCKCGALVVASPSAADSDVVTIPPKFHRHEILIVVREKSA